LLHPGQQYLLEPVEALQDRRVTRRRRRTTAGQLLQLAFEKRTQFGKTRGFGLVRELAVELQFLRMATRIEQRRGLHIDDEDQEEGGQEGDDAEHDHPERRFDLRHPQ